MTQAITRRILLAFAAAFIFAAFIAIATAVSQENAQLTITVDADLDPNLGAADIFVDGAKEGVLAAGCCMFISVTPGAHQLALRWTDLTISTNFEAEAGKNISFFLSAERKLALEDK